MVKDVRVEMGRILKVVVAGARVDVEVVVMLELEVEVEVEEDDGGDEIERTMRLVIGSAV
jgi:hypothetical protein